MSAASSEILGGITLPNGGQVVPHLRSPEKGESRFHLDLGKLEAQADKELIYEGKFSRVYIYETDHHLLAAKYVADRQQRFHELTILKAIPQHPNIIPYVGMYKGIFIFEYYPYNLLEWIRQHPLDEKTAARIFHQISHGLHCLHCHGIAHLDVKLENVMLDENLRVVLVDFGFSKFFDISSGIFAGEVGGSLEYISPDVLRGGPYHLPKLDIWSLGVTLYVCLHQSYPYKVDQALLLTDHTHRADLRRKMEAKLYRRRRSSPGLQDLLSMLLEPYPETRCELDEVLAHEWLSKRPPSPRHTL